MNTTASKPTSTQEIPATRNEAWGFYGTMAGHAAQAWPIAVTEIARQTKEPTDSARAFLDSKNGRHFADEVNGEIFETSPSRENVTTREIEKAVRTVATRWMNWTITRRHSKETGIPAGLPYLLGLVVNEAIAAEAEDLEDCATEERIQQRAAGTK